MKNVLAALGMVLVLVAPARARHASAPTRARIDVTPPSIVARSPDDTAVNARDRSGHSLTPLDQSEKRTDLEVTRRIRRTLVKDESLSVDAKNVKIVTTDGNVTLRGPVKSERERTKIVASARRIAGADNVDDRLEVEHRR